MMNTILLCLIVRLHSYMQLNFYRKTKPDVPPKYNEIDGKVDRRSFCGKYTIEDNGVPRYV